VLRIAVVYKLGRVIFGYDDVTELPLEPALARALLAAQELGCLSQALIVAGMLSCESVFFQAPRSKL
jgi:HrpA-like RNA helicase